MPQVTFNGTKINVEFTESSSRQQLNSGENISTLFGKIKKIFSDLKAVCFSGSYNDLSDKPSSLPANGGNADYAADADKLDGLHAEKFMRYEPNASLMTSINDMTTPGTYGVYTATPDFPTGYGAWGLLEVQAYGSICYQIIKFETGVIINRAKIINQTNWTNWKRLCDGGNADTLDNLHAADFVNANDRDQIQIPNNVDVPVWIFTKGKRFQRYMTNSANSGSTNVPNNSTDYVWYWYDGFNIFAREWTTGKYYICDTINNVFSGWKDVYTSGYKPYELVPIVTSSTVTMTIDNLGFKPAMVICASPTATILGEAITGGFKFTPVSSTTTQYICIAFR